MFGADIAVAKLQCFTQRELKNFFGARGERNVPTRWLLTLTDDLDDLFASSFESYAKRLEGLGCDAFAFVNQAEQHVLGADVVVV